MKTGTTITLSYDAEGRLHLNGGKLYDGHELVAEYNNATTTAVRRRWVHGPGIDEPVVYYQYPTATSTIKAWLIADHQGSVVAEVNTAGAHLNSGTYIAKYSYGPYGEPNINEGRYRYTGQQRLDGSEFHYYKARIYYPKLGRFLQTDPIGTADDMNLYAYVGNDPVNYTDPTGLWGFAGAGWGALAGGVGGAITGYAQDGYRGAFIGAGTGAVAGGAVGFVAPFAAARAGSSAGAAAATAFMAGVGSLGQQALANGVYSLVEPSKVSPLSYPTAAGAALAVPAAAVAVKAATAYGKAIVQATGGVLGAKIPATIPSPIRGDKVLAALYEGTTGAFGELLGGYSVPQTPAASAPSQSSASGK